MRYSLRTLSIATAIGPPILAVMWFGRDWIGVAIGWSVFSGFFALWYWMLRKSQANPKMRGEPDYDAPRYPQP